MYGFKNEKMRKHFVLLLFIAILVNCSSKAIIQFKAYDFKFEGMTFNGNPYKFSKEIEEVILKEKGNQFAAWEYSYVGDITKLLQRWNQNKTASEPLKKEAIEEFKRFTPKKAIPYIVKEASKQQITIINEAHHMPQHRVFTTRLLQKLYDVGYRHIGLEVLMNNERSDSLLVANKYPVIENGYYIKEPQFGNLVRQAFKIGYKVFSYESLNHNSSKEREINQAKHIANYITAHPKEKVLIHCGFGHGMEGNAGRKIEKAMAGRLSELSGINPLSINQTIYSETGIKEIENPYYSLIDINEPTVYINSKGTVFGKYKKNGWFDISVFHPRTKNNTRPEWLLFANRKTVNIDLKAAPIDFPCLVIAYLQEEKIGYAVPYDVQEVKEKAVSLILESGNYHIVLLNQKEESLIFEYQVKD